MKNMTKQKISDQFKSRLESLVAEYGPDVQVTVHLHAALTPELKERIEQANFPRANSPEKIAYMQEICEEAIQPLQEYLDALGKTYKTRPFPLRNVETRLNPSQIIELADQDYVQAILEDQPIYLIE